MYTGLPVQYYFEWLSGSKLILQSSLREFDVIGHRWVWSLATVGLLLDDVTATIVAGSRTKKTHSTQWTISTSCRRNTLCTDRDLEETPIITRVTTRVAWKTPPVHRLHNWRSSMKTPTRQEYITYRAVCTRARCPFVGLCLSVRLSRAYFNCIAGVPSAYSVESFDVMSYAAAVTHTFRAIWWAQQIGTRINADQLTIIQTVVDDACRTSRGLSAIEIRALIRYCSTVLSVTCMHTGITVKHSSTFSTMLEHSFAMTCIPSGGCLIIINITSLDD